MAEVALGLRDIVVSTSDICDIDGTNGVLIYRGYDIHDLAQNCTFEEVSYLLFNGKLPNKKELAEFDAAIRKERNIPKQVLDLISTMPKTEDPMNVLRTAISYLGAFDPEGNSKDPASRPRIARRLTAQFATVTAAIGRWQKGLPFVPPTTDLNHAGNFLYMLTGNKPDEVSTRTMDVALILHAEHNFNASTFTSRVVAATESDMYSAVTAAIGALKGPLHGGANTGVMKMLLEIGDMDKVESYIAAKMAKKEKIMGMGHAVYKAFDPRATELEKLSLQMGQRVGNTKWLDMSEKIWKMVHEQKGLWPNVDFFSASTYYTMGIDPAIFTLIFGVSRITGWCAHIIEQLSHNKLIRPSCEYTGPRGLKSVPIAQRG